MRIASGVDTFFVETAEQSRQGYLDYIRKVNIQAAQEQLEETVLQEEPMHLEKLRKVGKLSP
jgi:hypothetical protein